MSSFGNKLKKYIQELTSIFLNGLFAILPLTLTIALFKFSLRLLKGWLDPLNKLIDSTFLVIIPHSEILLMILFILSIGLILKNFVLRSLLHSVERLFFKIPLLRPVYSGIKQLVDAFSFQEDKASFKQVVLIEFPRKDLYSLGFLTGELPHELCPTKDERFFNIFIPTTPNPTTGYFIILPEKDIKQVHLSRQEAMALIISGGIILPDRFAKKE